MDSNLAHTIGKILKFWTNYQNRDVSARELCDTRLIEQ